MLFTTDQQTLNDLNIFGKNGTVSIYQLYNQTVTRGGAALLTEMFTYPLSDVQAINQRSETIRYFAGRGMGFPFQSSLFDAIVPYLEQTDERSRLAVEDQSVKTRFTNLIAMDAGTVEIYKGFGALVDLLKSVRLFLNDVCLEAGHPYKKDFDAMAELLADPAIAQILRQKEGKKFSSQEIAGYDAFLRFRRRADMLGLLRHIYALDVYCAVAKVASAQQLAFPKALNEDSNALSLEGLYHPEIKNAVANSVTVNSGSNIIFLTGANMAGKSTFMKSLSLALYLGHMGFPVAASKMEFSVLDGIYTTINLPDNLGMGASHFYAEVLRMKKMARELRNKKLFILFDELFRGTNVKDAEEATIAFTEAFAAKKDSIFVISTHIVEAGEILGKKFNNINFVFLPTRMDGNKPVYTYKLTSGITEDRHGMIIINNESVLKILGEGKTNLEDRTTLTNSNSTKFVVDEQTLSDLNLLGKFRQDSIFTLFNRVNTAGGERVLQEMFANPMTDGLKINDRSAIFSYFQLQDFGFAFDRDRFRQMESYLKAGTSGNIVSAVGNLLYRRFAGSVLGEDQSGELQAGLVATVQILNAFRVFLDSIGTNISSPYHLQRKALLDVLSDPRLSWLASEGSTVEFSLYKLAKYDQLLKNTLRRQMEELLEGMHLLDVYLSVANVALENDFNYAVALPRTAGHLSADSLRHPGLRNGVANPVFFDTKQNLMFLTGANMAGKSTFMKAFGIAVYLSHMGFPVPAKGMEFSIFDGLYSSINIADNLKLSHSHFFAEVMRVKHVAEEVASGKNMVVLFDELFKGTNVKDAYDGTLLVTKAFAKYRNCFYIISTHIIEVGQELHRADDYVNFAYMPTIVAADGPTYTYQLQKGLTKDRQGMMIIAKERILETLNEKTIS